MPDSEPVPGGPTDVWAGPADAVAFFGSVGMDRLSAPAALLDWRVVNIPTLCASPPPPADEFTMLDIVQGMIPGQAGTVREKLHNWVDRGLWMDHCQYTDSTPPPTLPPQDDIPGLPPGPVPTDPTQQVLLQIRAWCKFLVQHMNPRGYTDGDSSTVTETGHVHFTPGEEGDWTTWAVGARFDVLAKPDYAGRSNGGDFPVFYDLGWVSLDSEGYGQQPVRLQHVMQIESGSFPRVDGVYYNFPPGVEVRITPLYPAIPFGYGGG